MKRFGFITLAVLTAVFFSSCNDSDGDYASSWAFASAETLSNDYYFEGLMVAMIAKYQVLPTAIISVLFAILKIGAQGMETAAGVPNQIYLIIQTVVIFCMAAESGIVSDIKAKLADKAARLAARERSKEGAANE